MAIYHMQLQKEKQSNATSDADCQKLVSLLGGYVTGWCQNGQTPLSGKHNLFTGPWAIS
jgi:hypothetical protein